MRRSSTWRWILEGLGVAIAVCVALFGDNVYRQVTARPTLVYVAGATVAVTQHATADERTVIVRNVGNEAAKAVSVRVGPCLPVKQFRCAGAPGADKALRVSPEGFIDGSVQTWRPDEELTLRFWSSMADRGDATTVRIRYGDRGEAVSLQQFLSRRSGLSRYIFWLVAIGILMPIGVSVAIGRRAAKRASHAEAEAVRAGDRARSAEQELEIARRLTSQAQRHAQETRTYYIEQARKATEKTRKADAADGFCWELQYMLDKLVDMSQQLPLDMEKLSETSTRPVAAQLYDTALRYCEKVFKTPKTRVTGCLLAIEGDTFIPRAHLVGMRKSCLDTYRPPKNAGLEGMVCDTGSIQYCENLKHNRERYVHTDCLEIDEKAVIVVPVTTAEFRIVGVICVYADRPIPEAKIKVLEDVLYRIGQILGLAATLDPVWKTQ